LYCPFSDVRPCPDPWLRGGGQLNTQSNNIKQKNAPRKVEESQKKIKKMNIRKLMRRDMNSIGGFEKKQKQKTPQKNRETKRKIDKQELLRLRPKPSPNQEQTTNRINIQLKHNREIILDKYKGNFTGASPPPRGSFVSHETPHHHPQREITKREKERERKNEKMMIKKLKNQDDKIKNRLAKRDIFERAYWNWRTDKNKFKHKYKHFKQRLSDPQKKRNIEEQFARIHKARAHFCRPTPPRWTA